MNAVIAECHKLEYISLAAEYERQIQKNSNLYASMEVLRTALERISNQSTGESSRIACEALDSIYPIKGAAK